MIAYFAKIDPIYDKLTWDVFCDMTLFRDDIKIHLTFLDRFSGFIELIIGDDSTWWFLAFCFWIRSVSMGSFGPFKEAHDNGKLAFCISKIMQHYLKKNTFLRNFKSLIFPNPLGKAVELPPMVDLQEV